MSPSGLPFSSAVVTYPPNPNCKLAFRVIDQVHGIPNKSLPLEIEESVEIKDQYGKEAEGICQYIEERHIVNIKVNPRFKLYVLLLCHEIGHFIDGAYFGSTNRESRDDFEEWRLAVTKSHYYQRLCCVKANHFYYKFDINRGETVYGEENKVEADDELMRMVDYWMRIPEMFARSYTQWINTKTSVTPFKQAFSMDYRAGRGFKQWTDTDFIPIGNALTKLFERKGMIKP